MKSPPYRIVTERMVIRCPEPRDAPLMHEAVQSSIEHLRPWMPWVKNEPMPEDDRINFLKRWRSGFDRNEEFPFGIFDREEQHCLGGTGLHARIGVGALEIGYWIRTDRTRQRLATEAAAALTNVGFSIMGLQRMEIHCDPRNIASAGVPAKLGYALEQTIRLRCTSPESEPRDTMIWAMERPGFGVSAASQARFDAFDAAGRPLAH